MTLKNLSASAGLSLLLAGCTQHGAAWDQAWAACQAEAQEKLETAEVDHDQRSQFLLETSNECMRDRGFDESDSL